MILFVLIVMIGAVLFLTAWRRAINDTTSLKSYRVDADENAVAVAEQLKTICEDYLKFSLRDCTSDSHLYLRFAADRVRAKELGYDLNGIGANGFLVARSGNGLFLLAPDEVGLRRACWYLICRLVEKDGTLLIAQDEQFSFDGQEVLEDILIDGTSVETFGLLTETDDCREAAYELMYLLQMSSSKAPAFTAEQNAYPVIRLSVDPKLPTGAHSTQLMEGEIHFSAASPQLLKEEVDLFANTYLGWMYAGSAKEKNIADSKTIRIDQVTAGEEAAWIPEREAIITLWNTNSSRGIFLNESTSLKTDVMSMSEEQLYRYVQMLKCCGFTGIQLTDMCSTWAGTGGYEYTHERLRILADAAHSLDMKVTLWVWGAEFTGYGWVDETVTYAKGSFDHAYENPRVLATFEKYYSIYDDLADCADRVIAHFYDPGNLDEAEDVAFFSKLLREHMLARNPWIDFGVSCWVDQFDKRELINALGNQITLYGGLQHEETDQYGEFRSFCQGAGCRLGMWAWNTCEMEIDQLAQMNFNAHIIRNVYQDAKQYDAVMKPSYWSEMDSNHVLNVFSLYCAGHLLIDPDADPDVLTKEVAYLAVGEEYGERFADILTLLENARSGHSWDTYWWKSPDYILKSDDYPAANILSKSDRALETLQELIDAKVESESLPLPISLQDLLRLMVPQIQQIRSFAEFRLKLEEAEKLCLAGEEKERIQTFVNPLAKPVSEYNTIIGAWGQIEARAQMELLSEFCEKYELITPEDPVFKRAQKDRIYNYFVVCQKGKQEPVYFGSPYYQYGVAYGAKQTDRLVEEMIEEGLLLVDAQNGYVYLADWEHYRYAFN